MSDLLTISEFLGSGSTTATSSSASSPELSAVMTIGNSPFPMLYIYYKGMLASKDTSIKTTDRARVTEATIKTLREATATQLSRSLEVIGISGDTLASTVTSTMTDLDQTMPVIYTAMCGAMENNKQFKLSLIAVCQKYATAVERSVPSSSMNSGYYTSLTTKNGTTSKVGSYYPIINPSGSDVLFNCMEVLRIGYDNGMLDADTTFGIRAIDITTGAFVDEALTAALYTKDNASILGLPSRGLFTMNPKGPAPMMYRTFNGTNLEVTATVGTMVTDLTGMTALSWSIHREKQASRTLGKTGISGRSRGGRTIAGTMIFTITDHHPLIDLFAENLPERKSSSIQGKSSYHPQLLADELPAFDLVGIMSNEYGNASMIAIYGIEVMDEGSVMSIDNAITEITIQYTAQAIDPIVQVQADEKGNFDFLGVYNSEYMNFWRKRELAADGLLNTDLESEADSYFSSILSTTNA